MSSPLVRLTLWLFLAFSPQSVCGSWQYTDGQTDTSGGFTYQATVTENPANTFTGTAVLTAFSGSSPSIPASVPILITVSTTDQNGQPIQYFQSVNCTVKGFSGFTLDSDAEWAGDVNIIGNFSLNSRLSHTSRPPQPSSFPAVPISLVLSLTLLCSQSSLYHIYSCGA